MENKDKVSQASLWLAVASIVVAAAYWGGSVDTRLDAIEERLSVLVDKAADLLQKGEPLIPWLLD
jgi:hypothetical protein